MDRLGQTLEHIRKNNTTHVEVIEQIRDRMLSSNDQFAEVMEHHGKRMKLFIILLMVTIGVFVLAMLLPVLLGG